MKQKGQSGAYRTLVPDHQSSQNPLAWLEWGGVGGRSTAFELVKKLESRHSPCNSTSFWDKERNQVPMLSLELDVENFLEPIPLTRCKGDREGEITPPPGQVVIVAGQSLGPGLWVKNQSTAVCPLT